jgi:hypothetical protein
MKDYLNPLWQKKRLTVLQRDNWTCQQCQSKENTLQVHHKYYLYGKKIWDYPLDTLITLCEYCHPPGNPHETPNLNVFEPELLRHIAEIITSQPYTREASLYLDNLIEKCNV